jgi:hypothetical protein
MSSIDAIAKRRPSLVADAEIDRLVREFAARVLFIRADFHSGVGPTEPLPLIEAAARAASAAIALTLYGRSYWMVALPEETKQFGDPGAGLFMWVAGQTVQMMAAIEDGSHTEDEIKRKIERMLNDVVARLTGAKH